MAAFSDSRLVCAATFAIVLTTEVMFAARSLINPNLSAIRRVAFSSVCMVVSMWARLVWLFSASVALLADMRATSCMVCTSSWDVAAMSCAAAPTWWVDVSWAVIID